MWSTSNIFHFALLKPNDQMFSVHTVDINSPNFLHNRTTVICPQSPLQSWHTANDWEWKHQNSINMLNTFKEILSIPSSSSFLVGSYLSSIGACHSNVAIACFTSFWIMHYARNVISLDLLIRFGEVTYMYSEVVHMRTCNLTDRKVIELEVLVFFVGGLA